MQAINTVRRDKLRKRKETAKVKRAAHEKKLAREESKALKGQRVGCSAAEAYAQRGRACSWRAAAVSPRLCRSASGCTTC